MSKHVFCGIISKFISWRNPKSMYRLLLTIRKIVASEDIFDNFVDNCEIRRGISMITMAVPFVEEAKLEIAATDDEENRCKEFEDIKCISIGSTEDDMKDEKSGATIDDKMAKYDIQSKDEVLSYLPEIMELDDSDTTESITDDIEELIENEVCAKENTIRCFGPPRYVDK